MNARRLILSMLAATLGALVFTSAPALAAAPEAPVTLSPAQSVTATTAVLEGTLNPGASAKAGWYFAYSTEIVCAAGGVTPVESEVTGQALNEHIEVTGLEPSREYTFCLVATNEAGEATPSTKEVKFKTLAAPPSEEAEGATGVTSNAARLEAIVNANNQEVTKCEFKYGTDATLATSTSVGCEQATLPGLFGGQGVAASTGAVLAPGTTYYYRVVAKNKAGEEGEGKIESFTTVPAPHTEEVKAITATTATLYGTLTPLNSTVATEYSFDYRVGAECTGENATTPVSVGMGAGAKAVSTPVSELQPNATYSVCLVSSNAFGSEVDPATPPVRFKTLVAEPGIESEGVSAVKATEAHLEGAVNPNNQTTECKFQYGTDVSLATSTTALCEPPTFAAAYGGQVVGLNVGGLEGKTTYYYRVVVSNPTGVNEGTIQHFTTATAPETPEGEKAEPITGSTATLHGILNPKAKGEAGSYEFTYEQSETECSGPAGPQGELPFKTAPEPAGSSVGNTPEPVEAKITGLQPGATYTFCLLARNTVGETAAGSPVTFTTLATAPAITGESASNIEATTVTLSAQVNPDGATTTYHFEYGTTESYSQSTPETTLTGTLTEPDTATATITGLQPGTTYHYRVVAINAQSPTGTPGPDKTFMTNSAPTSAPEVCPNAKLRAEQPYGLGLPDCRAYEMVSPLNKNDNNILFLGARASVSDASPALAYISSGSFSEPQGASTPVFRYVARRSSSGWTTQSLTPPSRPVNGDLFYPFEELFFTPELSQGLLVSDFTSLPADEPMGYITLYLADLGNGSYQTVSPAPPEAEVPQYSQTGGNGAETPGAVGVSTDLSHVVFQQRGKLTENASPKHDHVYEWSGGQLFLVDVPPAGVTFQGEDHVGFPGKTHGVGNTWHAVSANGSRVIFTASQHVEPDLGQIYQRENPEQPPSPIGLNGECTVPTDACTIEVSKSQRKPEDPMGSQFARYWDASSDGSRVFFTSRSELTEDAYTGPEDNAANLYEYDVETGVLSDLTVDTEGEGAAVLGVVNASEDGSYVYFVAEGKLAEGATSGKPNLYVYHHGEAKPKFIATLAPATRPEEEETELGGDSHDWAGSREFEGFTPTLSQGPVFHTARVTPDGAALAFESELSLTGYDNEHAEPGECEGQLYNGLARETGKCSEVYLYDADTGKLVCASCDPSGARPTGPAELGGQEEGPAVATPSAFYLPRNLSEDGRRLFFQSPDALVPHDSNGKRDVYEWEAEGEGTCRQAAGCVFPISDVAGDNESHFMDASPNGEDVFIATADQLVPSDTDTRADVYDVKIGGGLPVSVAPPVCDNGDSCKPPVSPQPSIFSAPGSATFSGPGNIAPTSTAAATPKKKTVAQLKAEKLAKMLRQCKKDKRKKKRATCEKQTRKQYGATKAKKASNDRRAK